MRKALITLCVCDCITLWADYYIMNFYYIEIITLWAIITSWAIITLLVAERVTNFNFIIHSCVEYY